MSQTRYAVLAGLLVASAVALGEPAENFTLLDQNAVAHELHASAKAAAIVLMVQGNGCPIVRNAWPTFKQIREDYRQKGVEFLMVNSNLQDDRSSILREVETFRMDVPILLDTNQSVGESLKLIRTAEVLVIAPHSWEIVYRGPIDDRLTYDGQKRVASEHYLRDALNSVLAGQPVEVPRREGLGCLINFPNRVPAL